MQLPASPLLLLFLLPQALPAAEPLPARQQELLYLLKQDCGSCHGMTLKGGLGPSLLARDLAGKSDQALIATVLHGRPGTAMPPWERQLSREEVRWLISVLREGIDNE